MPSPIAMSADLSLGRFPSSVLPASSSATPAHLKNEHPSPALPDFLSLELYHKALEDERQKIEAFQRELPFCMQLLDDAIEASRGQLADRLPAKVAPLQLRPNPYTDPHLRSSLPGLGKFLNLKRKWRTVDDHCDRGKEQPAKRLVNRPLDGETAVNIGLEWHWNVAAAHRNLERDSFSKGCWRPQELVKQELLKSDDCGSICKHSASLKENSNVALMPPGQIYLPRSIHDVNEVGEVYHLSRSSLELQGVEIPNDAIDTRDINRNPLLPVATVEKRSNSAQQQRKPRRCWSPELHQRFLNALMQLGGSQAATPKQIRELMNVEGLTNDEVKSHLQKYRLHMRRPKSASQFDPQRGSRHLVVFGGIWIPPECGKQPSVAADATYQVSELYDSSMSKSNRLVAQDFFSNQNSTANFNGSDYRDHRQSQLVCRNVLEESEDEDARSESASLNEEEDYEKTENHLGRFRGFRGATGTNEDMKTESAGAYTNDEGNECDSSDLSREGSSQRETATSPVLTTLALKSFLTDPIHLPGNTSSDETSSADKSPTVLRELDPLVREANNILTRRKCLSPKREVVGITSETDLSIGCPMLQRSKETDDNSTYP